MAKEQKRLGEILIEAKLISPQQLNAAIADQKKSGQLLGTTLIQLGFVTEHALVSQLQRQLNLPLVDLNAVTPEEAALHKIKKAWAKKCAALPLRLDGEVPGDGDGRPARRRGAREPPVPERHAHSSRARRRHRDLRGDRAALSRARALSGLRRLRRRLREVSPAAREPLAVLRQLRDAGPRAPCARGGGRRSVHRRARSSGRKAS